MKVPDGCKILCKKNHNKVCFLLALLWCFYSVTDGFSCLFQADMRLFRSIIDDEYRIDWIVDNLPGAMRNDE
jgi:hypothetical protein